ncbi:MAG TPA: cellulose binding domain-containing protein [Actinospica sp.]|nr:cellulose binding domain-containing protein [Actinospica sp.]
MTPIGSRTTRAVGVTTGVSLVAASMLVLSVAHSAYAADAATINGSTTYQTITGFGASEAFGEAQTVMNASSSVQQQVLADLYSPTTGAGLTMLRNEISADSGSTIEPNAPSSPTAAPTYLPLSSINQDAGQLWFAQQIKADYGVTNVFADAWSAPAFMKTNNATDNGGAVCGLSGATCSSGSWVQAYANYLEQYAADYSAAGDPLTYVGPENEANLSTSYDSMQLSPAQTAQFLDTLGPTIANSGLNTKVECCATEGWDYASQYASAIEADSTALSYTKVFTSHGYTSAPTSALSGWSNPAWQTEWSTFETWDPAWDDGTDASGFTWAQHIYQGLTGANLGAFLYWWGSTTPSENGDNEGLLLINGSTITPSGRLWAFANYSRYIKPGAVRIGASSGNSALDLSAYKNPDGSISVVVLNTASSADTVNYALTGTGITSGTATPVLTNASNNAAAQTAIPVNAGTFTATVPARSLETFVITPGGSGGSTGTGTGTGGSSSGPASTCSVTYQTTSQWTGGFTANVTVNNTGTTPISGWTAGFTFPGDQKVTNAWNATVSQSGEAVTATNASYNGTIAAGSSTSFGFQGTWTSSDAPPTSFTINGVTCS